METIRDRIFNSRCAPCIHDNLVITRLGIAMPFGVIMVVNRGNGCVEHVSANVEEILGIPPSVLLGQRPTKAFPDPASASNLAGILQPGRIYFDNPTPLVAMGRRFEAICHIRDELLYIEIEPYVEAEHDYQTMIAEALDTIASQSTVKGLYDAAARMMQYVTGFDRIKLFKFMSHGHGVVVAERHSPGSRLRSFMNHYFSASDIPEAARAQLRMGKTRQKPTQEPPVPMLMRDASGVVPSGDKVDLTDAWLRGIHASDRNYNILLGVNSNIAFPVNPDSTLWGLFVVHNEEKKFLNYDCRVVIEQLTMMFASRLVELEDAEAEMEQRNRSAQSMLESLRGGAGLMSRIGETDDARPARLAVTEQFACLTPSIGADRRIGQPESVDNPFGINLRDLVCADGVAVLRGGANPHVHLVGTTPDALAVRGLATLFGNGLPAFPDSGNRVFATDALQDLVALPETVRPVATGLLAAPVGHSGDMILWFRREEVVDAVWAGRPHTPAELMSDKLMLTRDDFTSYRAPLAGASKPWSEREVALACQFAESVGALWSPGQTEPSPYEDYEPLSETFVAPAHGVLNGSGGEPAPTVVLRRTGPHPAEWHLSLRA